LRRIVVVSVACVLPAVLAAGCGGQGPPPPETPASTRRGEAVWERLGQWSGQKSLQTESFTSDTGAFRITWDTHAGQTPGEGTFLLTLHSAISGRPLQIAVDHRGPGGGTAYVNDDPRVFFAVVEASNIKWSFTVHEAVATRVVPQQR
jgi:hypothetical protein